MKTELLLILSIVIGGCSKSDFYEKNYLVNDSSYPSPTDSGSSDNLPNPDETPSPSPSPSPSPTPTNTPVVICDPMGSQKAGVGIDNHGLIGSVLDGVGLSVQNFSMIRSQGIELSEKVFFSSLYIPTRPFTEGFKISDTLFVKNSKGEMLLENYGLDLKSNLRLGKNDSEGYYQIAFISDDGIMMNVNDKKNNSLQIISADFQTASKLTCATMLIRMEHKKKIPITVNYFQGPKYHVALVMLWRKVADLNSSSAFMIVNNISNEALCNSSGNDLFFDPDNGSMPKQPYLDLLDSNKRAYPWKVVQHHNFLLPSDSMTNNCVQPTVGQ